MDIEKIVLLLKNSGLQNITVDNGFIEFDDPSCIYGAFDKFLEFAWLVIVFLTVIMLFGWAVLYIKNGVKINNLFNNAKTVILIFCILSLVKPIVNLVYGDNLFVKGCDRQRVSLTAVQELYDKRNKLISQTKEDELSELFDNIDSAVINDADSSYENENSNNDSLQNSDSTQSSSNTAPVSENDDNSSQNSGTGFVKVTYAEKVTIYINANGEKIKRSGGSAAWRNNNPGNIRKSKTAYSFGAIGETDKWAVFPDEETGLNAVVKLLQSKSYRDLSIKAAINKWAPSSDGNNPENYARKVSRMTGLPADAKINTLNDSELRKVANAIKTVEGWTVGKEEKL